MSCEPSVEIATPTEFLLRNKKKPQNFICGELVGGGELSFIVENLPKDGMGCPGWWMFGEMMTHFGTAVHAIQGNWISLTSDNLIMVNRLTAGGTMSVEDAAKQTWTGLQANRWRFTRVRLVGTPVGTAGNYSKVHVLFTR